MSNNKFKINDRVKTLTKVACNESGAVREIGSVGIIEALADDICEVFFNTYDSDGDNYWWYEFENLELIYEFPKPAKTQVVVYDSDLVYRNNQKPIQFFEDCCSSKIIDFLQEFLNKDEYELYNMDIRKLCQGKLIKVVSNEFSNGIENFEQLKEKLISVIGIDEFNKIFEKIELLNS